MARGKHIAKQLLDASQAALFAGIEIHNKPNIPYRYPTSVILIINAWELVLKAYIYKYVSNKEIYTKDSSKTITLSKAMTKVYDHVRPEEKDKIKVLIENLKHLNEYRCSVIHYFDKKIDPIIFMLLYKSVLAYNDFLKKYFGKDITKTDNLIILPVGMKLAFNPVDYLNQIHENSRNIFVNNIIQTVRELHEQGIEDSIIIAFSLVTEKTRNIKNADIIAKLCSDPKAVALRRSVRVTNDPNAPAVRFEPDLPPLTHKDLCKKIKFKRSDIKINKKFHNIMDKIKGDPELCQTRLLDPQKSNSSKKNFFEERTVDRIIELWDNQ